MSTPKQSKQTSLAGWVVRTPSAANLTKDSDVNANGIENSLSTISDRHEEPAKSSPSTPNTLAKKLSLTLGNNRKLHRDSPSKSKTDATSLFRKNSDADRETNANNKRKSSENVDFGDEMASPRSLSAKVSLLRQNSQSKQASPTLRRIDSMLSANVSLSTPESASSSTSTPTEVKRKELSLVNRRSLGAVSPIKPLTLPVPPRKRRAPVPPREDLELINGFVDTVASHLTPVPFDRANRLMISQDLFSDLIMVCEFVSAFKETLGIDKKTKMDLATLEEEICGLEALSSVPALIIVLLEELFRAKRSKIKWKLPPMDHVIFSLHLTEYLKHYGRDDDALVISGRDFFELSAKDKLHLVCVLINDLIAEESGLIAKIIHETFLDLSEERRKEESLQRKYKEMLNEHAASSLSSSAAISMLFVDHNDDKNNVQSDEDVDASAVSRKDRLEANKRKKAEEDRLRKEQREREKKEAEQQQLQQQKLAQQEEKKRLQRRVRLAPLGQDRRFRRFWAFPCVGAGLFVEEIDESSGQSSWSAVGNRDTLATIRTGLNMQGIRERDLARKLDAEPDLKSNTHQVTAWLQQRSEKLTASAPSGESSDSTEKKPDLDVNVVQLGDKVRLQLHAIDRRIELAKPKKEDKARRKRLTKRSKVDEEEESATYTMIEEANSLDEFKEALLTLASSLREGENMFRKGLVLQTWTDLGVATHKLYSTPINETTLSRKSLDRENEESIEKKQPKKRPSTERASGKKKKRREIDPLNSDYESAESDLIDIDEDAGHPVDHADKKESDDDDEEEDVVRRGHKRDKDYNDAEDQQQDEQEEEEESHSNYCALCNKEGDLLMCDSCPKVYHLGCLTPPLSRVPRGTWLCPACLDVALADKPRRSSRPDKKNRRGHSSDNDISSRLRRSTRASTLASR